MFSISDLTREFGVTSRTLRFYESEGLLSPLRQGTTRLYSRRDRARLAWILRGKRVGFSLSEIAEMMALYDPDTRTVVDPLAMQDKVGERLTSLRQQRDDIDAIIEELEAFSMQLNSFLSEALDAAGMVSPVSEPVSPNDQTVPATT